MGDPKELQEELDRLAAFQRDDDYYRDRYALDKPNNPTAKIGSLVQHAFWVYDAKVTHHIPYVVKGVISKGQLVVIWGAPGSGKSFVTTDMLCHVGASVTWHGKRVQRGICIYVVAESSRVHIENRIAALRQERPDLADADVLVIPLALDLLHEANGDVDRVIATAQELATEGEVVLIAIDTLAVTFGGGDENSSQDMGQYVTNIKRIISDTGAGVLVVHHCGKDDMRGMRGSSALLGALDGELSVEGKPGDGERMLKAGKIRDGAAGADLFGFKLRRVVIGEDQDGDQLDTCVVDALDEAETRTLARRSKSNGMGKNQRAALRVIEQAGGRLARVDWANMLKDQEGMPRNRVQEAIAGLIDAGIVLADSKSDPPSAYIP